MARIGALLLLIIVPLSAAAQESTPEKPFRAFPEPIPVGDFTLTERSGANVRTRDLLGNVWVAQFFYPGCNLCSRNTPTMEKLQELYRGKSDFRLVSFDLNESSREILKDYASSKSADPEQWLFVTGTADHVQEVIRLAFFKMTFRNKNPEPGDQVAHSTHLVLVDHNGNMVGYVNGVDADAADALKTEIDRLRVKRRLEQRIPVTGAALPYFNAILNSTCTVLLLLGWVTIRLRYETLHKIIMLLALATSMIFLSSYLFYHFVVLEMEPMRFQGVGWTRWVYFSILLSHTILAIIVAPLALTITIQGLRDSRRIHVKLARWTLPLWLYVSVTGVLVYWMLYRMEW